MVAEIFEKYKLNWDDLKSDILNNYRFHPYVYWLFLLFYHILFVPDGRTDGRAGGPAFFVMAVEGCHVC